MNHLNDKGWQTSNILKEKELDFILLTEPRVTSKTSSFNQRQIAKYIFHNPYIIVFHRINECDERKDTKDVNKYLMWVNQVTGYTIFINDFLINLYENQDYMHNKHYCFVRNCTDLNIFNGENKKME